MTGEPLSSFVVNPLVRGDDTENPDATEMRELFDELRTVDGLAHAKESIPNWEDYTLPGDPYPIPRKTLEANKEESGFVKGDSGFLANTDEEGWAEKFIQQVRARQD